MSNGCILVILTNKRGMKQRFNYMTEKTVKYNINNEYNSSSAVEKVPECKKTKEDKREIK